MLRKVLEWLGLWQPPSLEEWQEPQGEVQIMPMNYDDLNEVLAIERLCFPMSAWSRWSFASELKRGQKSCFIVARIGDTMVGFAGWRQEYDEAHVANIAIHPKMRGRGIGELLLRTLLEEAVKRGLNVSLLEVRKSNIVAQNLYRKYGYQVIGIRPSYYLFPREDAVVMKLSDIRTALAKVPPPKLSSGILQGKDLQGREK